jgi:hypothetical protein
MGNFKILTLDDPQLATGGGRVGMSLLSIVPVSPANVQCMTALEQIHFLSHKSGPFHHTVGG